MNTASYKHLLTAVFLLAGTAAVSQTVSAARTIRNRAIITESDLTIIQTASPGDFQTAAEIVGMEAKTTLYAGRPIGPSEIGPPTVVQRNQTVTLIYQFGALSISAEGRALARGGIGDRVKAMNISSRATVSGIVSGPGKIRIYR